MNKLKVLLHEELAKSFHKAYGDWLVHFMSEEEQQLLTAGEAQRRAIQATRRYLDTGWNELTDDEREFCRSEARLLSAVVEGVIRHKFNCLIEEIFGNPEEEKA